MKTELISTVLGGAIIGLIALAMDYFFLQHFFKTPISMGHGFNLFALLIYLFVPSIILIVSGRQQT